MRAFLRVKRQSMVTRWRLMLRFQACTSGRKWPSDGILRRPRHWRLNRNRFTVHYTPTHGSWLNQAEIEISRVLSRKYVHIVAGL